MSKRRRILLILAVPLGLLVLLGVTVLLALTTQSGLNTLLSLTNYLTKGQVVVESGQGRLSSGLTLSGLRYAGAGTELVIDELELQWQPVSLLRKDLKVQNLRVSGVQLHLPVSEEPEQATQPVRLPAFSFPVAVHADRVLVEDLHIFSGDAEQFSLSRAEAEQLVAQGEQLQFDRLAVKNSWMDIESTGQVQSKGDYPLQLEVTYGFDFEGYCPIRGNGQLTGDLAKLDVQTALSAPQEASLQGELSQVLNDLRWQAILQSPHLALDAINGSWPAQVFDQVQIEGSGDIRSYDLKVNGRVISKEFRRPLALQSALQVDWEGLVIHALRLADTAGHLDLAGSLDWSPTLAWDAKLTSKELNPDIVVENLPGSLDGNLATQGSWADGVLATELHIDTLKGQLRGYPLSASGAVSYREGALNIPGLNAAVGRTTLALQGTLQEQVALDLQLNSPDLQELLPELGGSLQAEATVRGSRQEPAIAMDLQGENLAFSGNRIETLNGTAQGAWNADGAIQAQLQASALQIGANQIDQAQIRLDGNFASHTLSIEAKSKEDSLAVVLAGKKDGEKWLGEMRQLQLRTREFGRWQQQKAAKLSASAQQAQLEPLCVQMNDASLCLAGDWRKEEQRWQASVQADALPLQQLQRFLPPEMTVSGVLNLDAEAAGQGAVLQQARVLGETPGLQLNFAASGASAQNLVWKSHRLEAHYEAERLQASWENELTDGSTLSAQLNSSRFPLLGVDVNQAPIQGQADIDIRSLTFLNALTNQQTRWTGMLHGNIEVNGTIVRPLISGDIALADGEVLVPELGLRLNPITLAINGTEGVLQAQAELHSQKGQLQVEAGVDLSGQQPVFLPITVQGDTFRVANQPGLVVEISPDIEVRFAENRIDVTGKVDIPHTRIETITFERAITPSGDVVVVDDPAGEPTVRASTPLYVRLVVAAGKDVLINTYGLRALIGGQLALVQEPGRPMTGNGQLDVREGSFSIYGKRVKIDSGRLLFSGGSLTNPGIEIRSENTEDNITAGMRVDGFLKSPRVNLYSRPYMDQGAIVSHLVEDTSSLGGSSRDDVGMVGDVAERLGMGGLVPYLEGIKQISMIDDIKLDTESDNTSLVFGSWLTPDFYVSYGKSLSGEGATFTTRYTLGKGFVVETESGETQSSGDIKYEFEH